VVPPDPQPRARLSLSLSLSLSFSLSLPSEVSFGPACERLLAPRPGHLPLLIRYCSLASIPSAHAAGHTDTWIGRSGFCVSKGKFI